MSNDTYTPETCKPACAPDTGCEMTDRFLTLADQAWMEVLKEKLKAEIEASCGEKLQGLAKFLAAGNGERHTHMILGKAKCEQFKHDLAKLMVEGATKK